MRLVRGAWKLLVGIKDALVLAFMLLFFGVLFTLLSAEPSKTVREGALLVALDGGLVEQPEDADPLAGLGGTGQVLQQTRLRDFIRAMDAAKDDERIKVVVLDLDRFTGGYPATVAEAAAAVGRVRASGKPVLAYATGYSDSGYLLAANASEIWVNPFGGTLFTGPGGSRLYYKGLLDKLGVTAHVYRVGTYKSAVEPYIRADQSPESRENYQQLYGAMLSTWRDAVVKARPKAKLDHFLSAPQAAVQAAGGDIAQANLAAGLVDKLGDRLAFGKRVAEIAGSDSGKPAGSFRATRFADWVEAHPLPTGGEAVGVLTVAGDIVDGKAGPGTAGGETLTRALLKGLAEKKLKALVVRVDSPGGSALASEQIRQAILQAKAQKLPVVVSMGGVAASGGYWVASAGDVIFAEPNTITGSIGIFGILPTFENTLAKIGVTTDGVRTTPLSGQPDVFAGTSPEVDSILQASIEQGYRRFLGVVSQGRKLPPQRVDQIGQGRVWDGGTAHQLRLVDRFGSMQDAIAEAARLAKLDADDIHAVYLEKEPGFLDRLFQSFAGDGDDEAEEAEPAADLMSRIAADRRAIFAQAIGDARRLAQGPAMQVRCLECTGFRPAQPSKGDIRLMDMLIARFAQ